MYKFLSNSITDLFIKHNLISDVKKDIYVYGFEIIISTIVYALIFIISALVTSTFWESLVFFFGFHFVRKFCGGFHANTYLKCHLMTAITHYIAIGFLLFFPTKWQIAFSTTILYTCGLLIILFAPVDHKNKRFIKNEYRNFRKKSCIYGFIIFAISTICTIHGITSTNYNIYVFAYSLGTVSATLSMLGAKLINLNERRYQS